MIISRRFVSWTMLVILIHVFSGLAQAAPDGKAIVVVTDMLPDDIDAIFALKKYVEINGIDQVLFITADGDVHQKARALHNFTEALGFSNALVVAGRPEASDKVPEYVNDYLSTKPQYLERLVNTKIKSDWVEKNAVAEMDRVFSSSNNVEIFLLANPASFNDGIEKIDSQKISRVVTMGLWKADQAKGAISSYNANTNPEAAKDFMDWASFEKVRVEMLPSELFWGLETVVDITSEARTDLLTKTEGQKITNSLIEGLEDYRGQLVNRLVQKYGMNAGFIASWDPKTNAWLQDSVAVMAALEPSSLKFESVKIEMQVSELKTRELGFPVKVESATDSTVFLAVELDQQKVGEKLAAAYRDAELARPFDVETEMATSKAPILWVGKAANDDMGLFRMMLQMGSRLKMVITESSNSKLTAEIIQTVADGYGRHDINVVAGKGQTLEQMAEIQNLGLEQGLLEGQWGENIVGEEALKRLKASQANADQLSGKGEIVKFLGGQEGKVDIVVTTSAADLSDALTEHPELISKINSIHMMGGWRTADGMLTRNWLIETDKVNSLFDLIKSKKIETFVYSSHLLGGSITKSQVPKTVEALSSLGEKFEIEKKVDGLRTDWNAKVPVPGFDVRGNYGPSLAYMMGVVVALGKNVVEKGYVNTQRIDLNFSSDKTVQHQPSETSSIHLVGDEAQSSMRIMDEVVSHLFRKAGESLSNVKHSSPAAGSCIRALGGL